MKVGKTMVLKIVIAAVIAFTVCFALYKLYPFTFIFVAAQQAKRTQVRLLCKTDHQALLKACRDLSKEVPGGNLKPGRYYLSGSDPAPEASEFPQPILDLWPSYVFIHDDGCVKLEMLGGLSHFGVSAYPEDYEEPFHGFEYGDIELIDGLWYYDDEYKGHPEYQKRIEALIQKGK